MQRVELENVFNCRAPCDAVGIDRTSLQVVLGSNKIMKERGRLCRARQLAAGGCNVEDRVHRARMPVSRGRPSAEGGGTSGTITRHSPSVVSLSYRMPARLYCGRVILVQTIVLSLESIQSRQSQLAEITQFLFQSDTYRSIDAGEAGPSPLFYKKDTHWNGVGPLYGALAIVDRLREIMPSIPRPKIDSYKITPFTTVVKPDGSILDEGTMLLLRRLPSSTSGWRGTAAGQQT